MTPAGRLLASLGLALPLVAVSVAALLSLGALVGVMWR